MGTVRFWGIDSDPVFLLDAAGFIQRIIARRSEDGRFHRIYLTGDASRRDGWTRNWELEEGYFGYPEALQFERMVVGGPNVRWATAPTIGYANQPQAGSIFIFARGSDNFPYSKVFRPSHPHANNNFQAMGWPVPIASDIAYGTSQDGWKFAFARRTDNTIIVCSTPPSDDRWMQWDAFTGAAFGNITVASDADGRLHVFVHGLDHSVFVRSQSVSLGNSWENWRRIGGTITSNIAVIRNANELLTLVVRGLDCAMWVLQAVSRSEGFMPDDQRWQSLGTPTGTYFLTDPVITRRPDGMLEVYAVATDKKIYVNRQISIDGAVRFQGWYRVGGNVWTGIEFRAAMVSVETGDLRHVDESGRFVEALEPLVGVSEGVMASASIPAIFPAVSLNGQTWVDGGVRCSTPIKAAIDAGAQLVYAICCSPSILSSDQHSLIEPDRQIRNWSEEGFIDIGARAAMAMMPHSIQQSDLAPNNPWTVPVYVIQPSFDVHDSMSIDAGLIRIARSYGWMRAYEAIELIVPHEAMRSSDEIIRLRKNIWIEEGVYQFCFSRATWGNSSYSITLEDCNKYARDAIESLRRLRVLKRQLGNLVASRRSMGYELPPDCDSWSTIWERSFWWRTNGPFSEITVRSQGGAVLIEPAA